MSLFGSFDTSLSGMAAQRERMDVIASNIANAQSTRTSEGGPYRRRRVVLMATGEQPSFNVPTPTDGLNEGKPPGVQVAAVEEDPSALKLVYDPDHPDSNSDGFVAYPNVDTVKEMVDMIAAARAYEANVTAFNASKDMALRSLDILSV